MLKFRRAIAIFILALITCQSVMAGLGEHFATFSDGDDNSVLPPDTADHPVESHSTHGKPGSVDLVDTNFCHAHGHCHLLALGIQIHPVLTRYGRNFVASHSISYHSQYLDPLLRPPARA